ncbi:MAG: hypothetical protein J3R72DRAFT_424989 [Linnemannia gamsii]|nr:MAG: hypothetical protein J3R72DRAFT_424989 [Linnemannia gamsii]
MPTQERVQAVRPITKYTLSNSSGPTATGLEGVVYVACHLDASGKEVILWEDILMAFKDALHVRHNLKILPFLKGSDLRTTPQYIPDNYIYEGKEPLGQDLPISPPLSALETTQQLSVSVNSSPLNSVTLSAPPSSPVSSRGVNDNNNEL